MTSKGDWKQSPLAWYYNMTTKTNSFLFLTFLLLVFLIIYFMVIVTGPYAALVFMGFVCAVIFWKKQSDI